MSFLQRSALLQGQQTTFVASFKQHVAPLSVRRGLPVRSLVTMAASSYKYVVLGGTIFLFAYYQIKQKYISCVAQLLTKRFLQVENQIDDCVLMLTGGNASGYAAREFVKRGVSKGELAIITDEPVRFMYCSMSE